MRFHLSSSVPAVPGLFPSSASLTFWVRIKGMFLGGKVAT